MRVPVAIGLKITLIVQLDFAASFEPQAVVETEKSPVSAPVNVEGLIVKAMDKLFLSITCERHRLYQLSACQM
jgi:hypothetical protein